MELTGMLIGGVTPLALPPELPSYVDEPVMAVDYVLLGAGSRSMKVKTAPEIFRLPNSADCARALPKPGWTLAVPRLPGQLVSPLNRTAF
jgi:prolyl-tRNA editing enzyme YbaK/EbsC (Cys-tRNA(Pro) deacylase)